MRIATTLICLASLNILVMHGCSSTATSQDPQPLQVELALGTQQYSATTADNAEVTRHSAEQLALSGSMRLPNPCFELKASGASYPDSLIVIIEATPLPQMCQMAEITMPYEVVINSAISAEKALKVKHTFAGTSDNARSFDLDIE